MGYACPVCETPQRDGEHLANHLAFTAMLHGDDHEAWLDERVDGWGDRTPAELTSAVTDHAEETEYDEVFEDTTGTGPTGGSPRGDRGADATHEHGDHAHEHDHAQGHTAGDPTRPDVGGATAGEMAQAVTDEAVESVLADAQELTEEMYGLDDGGEGEGESESEGEGEGEAANGGSGADGGNDGTDDAGTDDSGSGAADATDGDDEHAT